MPHHPASPRILTATLFASLLPLSILAQAPAAAPLVPQRPAYYPPPLSDFSALADPAIITAFKLLETGDLPGFFAELHRLAEAGSPSAQLLYGMQFVPLETFAALTPDQLRSGNLNPVLVPAPPDTRPGRPSPTFPEAVRWLRLASTAGSGQASEVVAQLITRMHGAGLDTTLTINDAIRYRALAIHQGYDFEAADLRCLRLLPGAATLTCDSTAAAPCPDEATMDLLRTSGLRGTLYPGGTTNASYTAATMHPGGPPAHALIILDHPVAAEIHLPLPRHTTAIYLQASDGFHTLTPFAPVLDRDIILRPEPDPDHSILGSIEDMNGGRGGSTCLAFPPPHLPGTPAAP